MTINVSLVRCGGCGRNRQLLNGLCEDCTVAIIRKRSRR